jgi:hypothetical protein
MGFFEHLPQSPAIDAEEPSPRAVWERSDLVLGAPVARALVLARSDKAVVGVSGLLAHPNGFELALTYMLQHRDPTASWPHPTQLHDQPSPEHFLRFGLLYSDGTKMTNLNPGWYDDADPPTALLQPAGGSGSDQRWDDRYWVWPLPPSGEMTFVCEWPAYGITETRVSMDAKLIREAAAGAIQLWPEPTS